MDAAYGGFFLFTEGGRRALVGIERADSIILDPHKGLFLPYGTGALLVRDGEALKRAHALSADYMPTMQEEADLIDFNVLSPELSRDFRGLRVWLPLKMHGAAPFRANLDEKLALTRWAGERLRGIRDVEIVVEPQLSIVAFRRTRAGCSRRSSTRRTGRSSTGSTAAGASTSRARVSRGVSRSASACSRSAPIATAWSRRSRTFEPP